MTRKILELNGDNWRLGQAPKDADPSRAAWDELDGIEDWLPATVPGNVRGDLEQAGRLPPLSFGTQVEAAQWVDDHCWWLIRDFSHAPSPDERMHLVLHGVDYVSDVFLNGHHLGRHEGMFSAQTREVTALLGEHNRLAVRIVGSKWLLQNRSSLWEKLLNHMESRAASLSGRFPHRRDVLKCQMSFGWDFAPALRTMGIWDDVYVIVSGDLIIQQVSARQYWKAAEITLSVGVEIDASRAHAARVVCALRGDTFESVPISVEKQIELQSGAGQYTIELAVPEPHLWWPWDHGNSDLYRLSVEVWDGALLSDSYEQTVGLRQIEMDGWTLRVNGRSVFARGANWVPPDILPGRITEADYDALLNLARQANMNMLRVWGGGLREKHAFYDLCDRMGILVWQELPFACAFLTRYPRSDAYLRLVADETRAIVCDLREHPSLTLWCGGNEFDPRRNEPLVSTLAQTVAEADPTRPFLSVSPANGDSHFWRIWHHFEPPSAYRRDETMFASEFGMQAPPDDKVLSRFIPPDELWPPGRSWVLHGAGLTKLWRYAWPFLENDDPSLMEFVRASQQAQAHGLQIAIEHYRRRKTNGAGGVLLWQFNEPWPAISWAIVDHYRQPKPAYETVRRLFNPVLVSLDYPAQSFDVGDRFQAEVWIVSDLPRALPNCDLDVVLYDAEGRELERTTQELTVEGDSARVVGSISWDLPQADGWRVECCLSQDGQALAHNEYDLTIYDDIRPGWNRRLWRWLAEMVVPH